MAQHKTYRTLSVGVAGVTTTFSISDAVDIYEITPTGGAAILVADVIITALGTPVDGTTFTISIVEGFTLGANTFSLFGVALTASQVLYNSRVNARYNGTSWELHICPDAKAGTVNIDGGRILTATVASASLAGGIVNTKLLAMSARGYLPRGGVNGVWESVDAKTNGQFVGGNGTDVGPLTMSGDATLSSGAITIANDAITTVKILDANVTLAKLESKLIIDNVIVPASFETGEVGAIKIKMNFACSITDIYAIATKAIAATDAGTVVLKNNAGTTMTVTTPISFAASDAYGTSYTSAVTANNTFAAGEILTILTAKATVGGKVLITLKSTRV